MDKVYQDTFNNYKENLRKSKKMSDLDAAMRYVVFLANYGVIDNQKRTELVAELIQAREEK